MSVVIKLSRINVLVVGPSIFGDKGGQVTHMINIMNNFKNDSHFCLRFFYSSSALDKSEFILIKMCKLILRVFIFPFYLLKIDVVHINSSFDNKAIVRDLFLSAWVVLSRRKLIIQYHGGEYSATLLNNSSVFRKFWFYVTSKASDIFVLTRQQYTDLLNCKLTSVTKVVNFVGFPNEILKPVSERYTFIFIGRIIRQKGIFIILDAVNLIDSKIDFDVIFYGDGDDRHELVTKISAYSLQDRVFYKGSIDGQDKDSAYLSANAFLLPSFYPEGLPYSVIEAMSFGLPVISTNAGSLSTIVRHLETGLIVKKECVNELQSAMTLLLSKPDLNDILSVNSRSLIKSNYSSEQMIALFHSKWIR